MNTNLHLRRKIGDIKIGGGFDAIVRQAILYFIFWKKSYLFSLTGNAKFLSQLGIEQDQGSKAPSTSAFHQLNNELSMYIQYLICIPRVLDQHQIVTSKNRDISLNEKQLFHENNPSIMDRSSIYLSIDQSIHQYDQ